MAVTEEVSLTALPANKPKPSFDKPSIPPKVGKTKAAKILKEKLLKWLGQFLHHQLQ